MEHKRAKSKLLGYRDPDNFVLGLEYNAPLQRYKPKSGWARVFSSTSAQFEWAEYQLQAFFSMFDGAFLIGEMRHFFHNLAPFEVVNSREWHNEKPIEIRRTTSQGQPVKVAEEFPSWEIASFDQGSGKRLAVLITHAPREDVFTIQYRLNQLLNEAKRLTEGYQPELRAAYHADRKVAETDGEKAMIAEIIADFDENAPMWDWD